MHSRFLFNQKYLLYFFLTFGHNSSTLAFEGMRMGSQLRLLGSLLNQSAACLLPLSGTELKPSAEGNLTMALAFAQNQRIFYELTPVWRAHRTETGVYSNFGYRKSFEASQLGLHLFADWNKLEPINYFHGQWGFGIEWTYLQKHLWSLSSTGYPLFPSANKHNPSVKSVEAIYAFQSEPSTNQYRFSLHYFFHKATLLDHPSKAYDRPLKATLHIQHPFYTYKSTWFSRFMLIFEPSYARSTIGKTSDLCVKLGFQFQLDQEVSTLALHGSPRSLIRSTAHSNEPAAAVSVEIKEQLRDYTVYPILEHKPSHYKKDLAQSPGTSLSSENAQAIQDFWNQHQFTWYEDSEKGTSNVVGKGPTLLKEGLKEGPIRVEICNQESDVSTILAQTTYAPTKPTVTEHTHPENYGTENFCTVYSDLSIQPTKPSSEYSLLPLAVLATRDTISDRDAHSGYNLDKIIAVVSQAGSVELQNWTPRIVSNPILEINQQHYCVRDMTLDAYQTLVLGPAPEKITSLNFVDPSPFGKWMIAEFEKPVTFSEQSNITNTYKGNAPIEPTQIAHFNTLLCTYKRALNRLDLFIHFMDLIHGRIKPIEASYFQEPYRYYVMTPKVQPIYAIHAYKSMLSLCWRSFIGGLASENEYANCTNLAAARKGTTATIRFTNAALDALNAFAALSHAINHCYSYHHESGFTYGWANELEQYIKNYYVNDAFLAQKDNTDFTRASIEKQRYFATYVWTDSTHIEVQFYGVDDLAPPLTRFAIISWDENYVPFFGTERGVSFASGDVSPMNIDEGATPDYTQKPKLEQLGYNRLRIELQKPRISHAASIALFAGTTSVPPYTLDDSLAILIYPRMRILIVPPVDFSLYPWTRDGVQGPPHDWHIENYDAIYMELSEEGYESLCLNSGNTGHLGREPAENFDYITLSPKEFFLPHARHYRSFSIEAAKARALELGYTGLGTYPTTPNTQLMSSFSYQFMYLPRALGLDPNTQEPCLVEYSDAHTSRLLDANETATMIFLKK